MNTDTPTPRTYEAASDGWTGDAICVSADFARQLERELAEANAKLAEAKETAHTWFKQSELFHKVSFAINDKLEKAEATLVSRDKEIARLRDCLERISNWKWGYDGDCGVKAEAEATLAATSTEKE